MKVGYKSIKHQGHAAALAGKPDEANPYPRGSSAFYEYQDGCNAARRGEAINSSGWPIAASGYSRLPKRHGADDFRRGASY